MSIRSDDRDIAIVLTAVVLVAGLVVLRAAVSDYAMTIRKTGDDADAVVSLIPHAPLIAAIAALLSTTLHEALMQRRRGGLQHLIMPCLLNPLFEQPLAVASPVFIFGVVERRRRFVFR